MVKPEPVLCRPVLVKPVSRLERLALGQGRRLELPTYPWQRRRYWLPSGPAGQGHGGSDLLHPLLGAPTHLAESQAEVFTARLSLQSHPWLADHRVFQSVVFPATGFLELALSAGAQVGLPRVEELTLVSALLVPESAGAAVELQLLLHAEDAEGRRALSIHSRAVAGAPEAPHINIEWVAVRNRQPSARDFSLSN